tara:strand:+ start:1638 stop:2273 length:636 start_codon:yes stop_codon:yes gene_type:complete
MHLNNLINVILFGSENFTSSFNELKEYFNFNVLNIIPNKKDNFIYKDGDVLIVHEEFLPMYEDNSKLLSLNVIKIVAWKENKDIIGFDEKIQLPCSIFEINDFLKKVISKKNFITNSSIKIKDYILDKNEKKLTKNNLFVIVTEKEIQLLELLSRSKINISKKEILISVWNYSSDADTHTVETHIYRLRKKIKNTFSDDNFIKNNEEGYLL